ncbi:hypothetical protein J9236_20785 [Providencia rettgeri]|uniref:hypothetical protein n=1 Tax=Providencia rettgeri TaxID=587 RepID=UPI001B391CD0|nr:hypothetical protein [Providencia rettgeri]MBQ0343644.1 hypothetical protein [Providencia rettgeri]
MNIFDPTVFPAVTALLGSIFGVLASILSGLYMESRKHKRNVETYSAGFIAEVESLASIIRYRGYVTELETAITSLPPNERMIISILIPNSYSRFYDTNIAYVGLLKPMTAKNLVTFHQLLQSVVQDFKPESALSTLGHDHDSLNQLIDLLNKALFLADEIKKNK